ncbi:histidine ammonia-lyase [Fluviispira multicolorata]|uniref:Histidine ammonia-lyase n=1 Tax=Fluviispira multicolorata TaxID=2654512 RepID=A0A833JBT8_9BACT|nr:histidine ammonia-lyase [Fluviispira multicolorata]KAB8029803.1 histidine ammonia-lyase [Fluviispira multicolorata]
MSFLNDNISQKKIVLGSDNLTLENLIKISRNDVKIDLFEDSLKRVEAARNCVEERLESGGTYYGINTGFGALANVKIPSDKLDELQINLIRSHACGVGEPLAEDIVRATLVLRIMNILKGNSGARKETVYIMQSFLNLGITPYVPSRGSVGASGDLAPLAHIALNLIGEGKVYFKGNLVSTREVLDHLKVEPLKPKAKEGLCLINGTQVMTAIGLLCCYDALNLLKTADITAAISLDAVKGTLTAFRPEIQNVRPYNGQKIVSTNISKILVDDGIRLSHMNCDKVQDAYSFRCVPQVHGAARNAFTHVLDTLLLEAHSSTDNPLVFPETNEILSGGNFHGEPVALVLDYFALAMSEIGNISERRLEKLVNAHMSGLPPFLTLNSGLCSGFMIPHVVAAALVNENKVLSTPASVDSIATSAEKEDHVSMGMTSANKMRLILKNVSFILSLELLAGVEGVEFHLPLEPGAGARAGVEWTRNLVPAVKNADRSLSEEIEAVASKLLRGELVHFVNQSLSGYTLQ